MNFLTAGLPAYLKDSLLCFTVVNSKVVDGASDIATCNSNGYMYEIKNKKVVRCLNLVDKGISITCSYVVQNEVLRLYYLVLTESSKLLIIRRTTISLQVIRTYKEVKGFEVYDFESLGFPQIKINFMNGVDDLVCTFPPEEPVTIKADDNKIMIDEDNDNSSPLVESLEEKLQIINKHIDELTEEYNLLRKQFSSKETPTEFGLISVGSVKFTSPLKNIAQPVVKVCDKWLKVIGSHLVLGVKICNCSSELVQDVELLLKHEEITDYAYRVFQPSGDLDSELFSIPGDHRSMKPAEEVWVVGAFRVPAFRCHSRLLVPYCLAAADSGEWLVRDEFEVTVLDIASWSRYKLEEGITVEDLMAMRTVQSETRLELRTEDLGNDTPGLLLVNTLGFRKIKHYTKDELFCCTSAYLNGVFVALRQITENPSVWEMLLLTSHESQVYFLANALYDLLPENAAISCRGRKMTDTPAGASKLVSQSERQLNWSS